MNKKVFTGIIFLMGISILGIIAMQLIWMNNAITVKNELFNSSVNEALINTARKLEDMHNFKVVKGMVLKDSLIWQNHAGQKFSWSNVPPPPPPPHIKRHIDSTVQVRVANRKSNNNDVIVEIISESGKNRSYSYTLKTDAGNNKIARVRSGKENDNTRIVIVDSVTTTNLDSLFNVKTVKIDSVLTILDSTGLAPDFTKRVQAKAVKLKSMANQVVTELAEWDVNDIDTALVNEILTGELKERHIPVLYEFGVLQDSVMVCHSKSITDTSKIIAADYAVNLYPNEIFRKNLKLAVWFPEKSKYIFRSMNWLLLASLFFSLIILITFGVSIFYILRQKKISEMKSDFINNMTHEFKTPIATISVATDSITNEKVLGDPEKIRYFAGMIKKENTRMNRQVEDILTIARLDKKDFEFKWEQIDIHDIINDAVQGIMLQVEKRDGKINLELNAADPIVTTDKIHGTNIFYNLIDNAIKYSVNKPEIKISTKNQKNGVLISVEDKGIGMNRSVQARIFERFYRQTSGNIHNVKGFGLGLNYVKAVVEANNGNINVQSEPGKGSRFEVFLPKAKE